MGNEIGRLVYNDVKREFSNEKPGMMLSHLVGCPVANFFRYTGILLVDSNEMYERQPQVKMRLIK